MKENIKIAVIGLGYVGLPLARLFATKFPVVGFDINGARVKELQNGHDSTLEVEDEVLQSVLLKTYPVPAKKLNGEKVLEFAGDPQTESDEESSSPFGGGQEGASREGASGLFISRALGDISECNHYIITVPTPIDKNNRPI